MNLETDEQKKATDASFDRILVDVGLVHYPVLNRRGETIGSAVTNLDLHDIARAGRTYGIGVYWVITPFAEQRELAQEIVAHWTHGYGGQASTDRSEALSLIRVCADLASAVAAATRRFGERPLVLATGANYQDGHRLFSFNQARCCIAQQRPLLLLFGTAWGLSPAVLAMADGVLPPVQGRTDFNHLSVRSAASIIMDRLLGR